MFHVTDAAADSPSPFVNRRTFSDSDEAAASISGAAVEYSLLAPPLRKWTLDEVRLEGIVAGACETGAAFGAMGACRPGLHTFMLPLEHGANWMVNGQAIAPSSLAYFAPNAEHVAAIDTPVEWARVQITPEDFEPIFAMSRARDFTVRSPVAVFHPSTRSLAGLKRALRTTIQAARDRPELLASEAIRNTLRKLVLDSLLDVFPSPISREKLRYRDLTSRTHEFLRANAQIPISVAELCQFLSVSERSLRRLFREVFGTSPAHYLRVRRFHQARRALKDPSDVEATVTSVSNALGFLDMGRFASDYRELFGELPSQTLARRR